MSVLNKVTHYQKKIERNKEHTETLIHCINKLHKLPITGQHLEETGVGKTINALRKFDGVVGNAAKALVWKWKRVVFAETIAEEEAKNETGLKNPVLNNFDENFLNAAKTEEQKDATSTLSTISANDGAKMLEQICEEEYSSTANLNVPEYESQRCDTLHESTEEEDTDLSSTKSISHVFGINRSSTKAQEQNGGHYRSHGSKHSHARRDKPQHNKRSKGNGLKIKLKKVYTEDESIKQEEKKSFSFCSFSELTHCSKRAEKEIKSLESEHCRKKRGQQQKTDRLEKCTGNISKQSKSSEKVKKNFANDSNIGYFTEETRMGDATGNKRSGSTMRNSKSVSSPGTKTRSCSPRSISETAPNKLDLCLVDEILEPLDVEVDLASLSPEIPFNTNPVSHLPLTKEEPTLKYAIQQVSLPKQHRQRMKIYSGRKTGKSFPTLSDLCQRVLMKHIDALEYTGGVPYDILKPILRQATPEQLFQVEYYNSYLLKDTNELWEFHCWKEFPSSQLKPMETEREMYLRCLEEREAKFKALTSSIQQSLAKSSPVRQMKLVYADSDPKPPQNVTKQQAKYGSGNTPKYDGGKLQSSASTSAAKRSFIQNSTNSTARKKPRMAPLMKKTMKLAKSFKR